MFQLHRFFCFVALGFFSHAQAQQLWMPQSGTPKSALTHQYYKLQEAPSKKESSKGKNAQLTLAFPNEEGVLENFNLKEVAVLSPQLQQQFPWIRTFIGTSAERKGVHIRVSQSRKGYWSWMKTPQGDYFMQPSRKKKEMHLWYKRDSNLSTRFSCTTPKHFKREENSLNKSIHQQPNPDQLRTFRIAVVTTGEYGQYWADDDSTNGSPAEDVLAEIVRSIHRINEVFETDLQVHLELVSGTELIHLDPATDPFNGSTSLNTQTQNYLDAQFGNANYDLGHLLDYDSPNGNAGSIGNVCRTGSKGSAFSAHDFRDAYNVEYLTDYFDLDFFGHELGHQFGGSHTFGFSYESFGANMEPGSGSTIMAYAGITGTHDVQNHGDAYFHYKNIQQINNYIASQSCQGVGEALDNTPPTINPLTDVTIPKGTAYKLNASASDPDTEDVLYYCWEQIDDGRVRREDFGPTKLTGAMARSRPPRTESYRYIPQLPAILSGNLTQSNPTRGARWETVSEVGRDLNWGLTVRDRMATDTSLYGKITQASFEITVDANAGPFRVISQASNTHWTGGQWATIRWDVAQTNQGTIGVADVRILLSTDGGQHFDHVLAAQTPNDGQAEVVVPLGIGSPAARIMVEPINNIFLAVNAQDFSIQQKDISLQFDGSTLEKCSNDSNQIGFQLNRVSTQSGTIRLSIIDPTQALSLALPQSQFSTGQTTGVLEISNLSSIPSGDYQVLVRASVDGQTSSATTADVTLNLNIRSATIATPVLQSPTNGLQDVEAYVQLNWAADTNASRYRVEVSTVENFSTLTFSSTTESTQITTPQLASDEIYYWRVKALNSCGESSFSEVRNFRTEIVSCQTYAAENLPQSLTDATATDRGVTRIEILVQDNLPILDIECMVDITHTWVEDLELKLISPGGQTIQLSDQIGENQDNYRNTVFDQEATTPITSGEPPYTGRFRPAGDLSLLYNTDSGGTWILEVTDHQAEDVGSIRAAELTICYNGVPEENSDQDIIPDSTDNCPFITNPNQSDANTNGIGDLCDLYDPENLRIQKFDATCVAKNNGQVRITARALFNYTARLEGSGVNQTRVLNDQAAQFENLAPGNYTICITSSADDSFESCFETTVQQPEALQVQVQLDHFENQMSLDLAGADSFRVKIADQLYQVDAPGRWTTTLPKQWTRVEVTTELNCQGKFSQWIGPQKKPRISPNPATSFTEILLPEADTYSIYMLTMEGHILLEEKIIIDQENGGSNRLNLSQMPPGVYVIQVHGSYLSHTFKLIKK